MTGLRGRVRERLRTQVVAGGGSHASDDPELFAEVEVLLRTAADTSDAAQLRREVRRLSSSPFSASRPGPYPKSPDVR